MHEDSAEQKPQSNGNYTPGVVATEPLPTPESGDSDTINSGTGSLVATFIASLIAIGFIGLIYGATFNWRLISVHGQYFGELQDTINLVLFMPLATILFGVIAIASRNIFYWFYPLVAFFVASTVSSAAVIHLLVGYIPALPPASPPNYLTSLVTVMLAYILVHAFIWPLRHVIRSRKMRTGNEKRVFAAGMAILLVVLSVCGVVGKYSEPLLISQKRVRAAVHIPGVIGPIGSPQIDYTLYRNEGSARAAVADVMVRPVEKWWDKGARDVCGGQTTTTVYENQSPANKYATTPGGIQYAGAVFDANASKPATATAAFKEYRYCFVIGYQHYILVRNDRGENAGLLQKYASAQLIDTIAKAPSYIIACAVQQLPYYCTNADAEALKKLNSEVVVGYQPPASSAVPGVTAPTANKNAYKQTGKLSFPQWGINFPLSADIQDAYSTQKKDNEFVIKLHSLDPNKCFDDDGVAYLMRRALSDIHPSPNTTITGKVVGDYVYSLSGNAGLQFCVNRGSIDSAQATKLDDVFEWAEANIQ
jgi:hypothetical protein